jgi:hypothetical protein
MAKLRLDHTIYLHEHDLKRLIIEDMNRQNLSRDIAPCDIQFTRDIQTHEIRAILDGDFTLNVKYGGK